MAVLKQINPIKTPKRNINQKQELYEYIPRHETQREHTVVHEERRDLRKQTHENDLEFLKFSFSQLVN